MVTLSKEQLQQLQTALLEIPGKYIIGILNFLNKITQEQNEEKPEQ